MKQDTTVLGDISVYAAIMNVAPVSAVDAPYGGVKWSGHGSEDGAERVSACMVFKTVRES